MSRTFYLVDRQNKLLLNVGALGKNYSVSEFTDALEDLPTLEVFKARLKEIAFADTPWWGDGDLEEILAFVARANDVHIVDEEDSWELYEQSRQYAYARGCPRCEYLYNEESYCGFHAERDGVIEVPVKVETSVLLETGKIERRGIARLPSAALFFRHPMDVFAMAPKDTTLEFTDKHLYGQYDDLVITTSAPETEDVSILLCGVFAGDGPESGIIGARVEQKWDDKLVEGSMRRLSHQQMVDKYGPNWRERFEYFPRRRTPLHVGEKEG